MQRWSLFLPLVALLVAGALVVTPGRLSLAQEATPVAEPAEEMMAPPGLGFTLLGLGELAELPAPAAIELSRFEFAPNSGFALSPDDPAVALVAVETGTLSFIIDGPMTIMRAGPDGMPGGGDPEEIPAGEVFTMSAGDSAIFPPLTSGETLNLGTEPASVLVVNIYPRADAMTPDAAATPVP